MPLRARLSVLSALAVLAVAVSFASADNWASTCRSERQLECRRTQRPRALESDPQREHRLAYDVLPEEGQSGIAVWGDRVFLTTMKPLAPDATKKEGHEIVGYCLDSHTGKILGPFDLAGVEDGIYAYGFSDPTSASPGDGRQARLVLQYQRRPWLL